MVVSGEREAQPVPLVLVVANSADQLLSLQKAFRAQGMKVVTAEDGLGGLHLAYHYSPDIIVAYADLPAFSGFAMCWLLKTDPSMAKIPMFLLYDDPEGSLPYWHALTQIDYFLPVDVNLAMLAQTAKVAALERGCPGFQLRADPDEPVSGQIDNIIEQLLIGHSATTALNRLASHISAGNRYEMARNMFDVLSAGISYRAAGIFFLQSNYSTFFLHTKQSLPSDQLNALLSQAVVPHRPLLKEPIRLMLFAGTDATPRELGRWSPQSDAVATQLPVVTSLLQKDGQVLGSIALIVNEGYPAHAPSLLLSFAEHASLILYALYLYEDAVYLRNEAHKAQADASAQQQTLIHLAKQVSDGVFLVNSDNRVVAWNAAAARITGCSEQSLLARRFMRIEQSGAYDRYLSLADDPVSCAWPSGAATAHFIMRTPAGRQVPVTMTVGSLKDATGHDALSIYTFADSSVDREVARLRQGIHTFATQVLQGPASTIQESIALILQGNLGPVHAAQREALLRALQGAEQVAAISRNALALAPEEESGPRLRLRPTDLANLLLAVIGSLRPELEKQHINIELQSSAVLPMLRLDGPQMAQALMQLLSSAGKFSPPGSRYMLKLSADQGRAHIVIQATGLDPVIAAQLNTGSELDGARSIVAAHGGVLAAESFADKGSTFTISLPIPAAQQPLQAEAVHNGAA